MATPVSLGSRALRASRRRISNINPQTRGLAAAASGSFQYETGNASGVKYASRDLPGPTTTLTIVAKAGTRYQPFPGATDALEKFAFKVRAVPRKTGSSTLTSPSLPKSDQPSGSPEKQNFLVANYLHIILEKT